MDEYELKYNKIKEENQKYLDAFNNYLTQSKLTAKTIRKHYNNIDFFLNEYVAGHQLLSGEEAYNELDEFMGYFFIHKCMWSTPESIAQYCASLNKFYKLMANKNLMDVANCLEALVTIKNHKEIWMEECWDYNNDSSYMMW